MTAWEIIVGIVLLILAVLIIAVVLLQQGRQANLGAISGAADTFMEKGKARTVDALLAKWTKVLVVAFMVLMLGGMLITQYLNPTAIAKRQAAKNPTTTTTTTTTTSATTTTTTGSTGSTTTTTAAE